jgi:hypothetical protein
MRVLAAEQPHFAPKTYWWNRLLQSDVFVIMDNDYFNRKHWQNRTEILLAGKRHRFTVPVRHEKGLKVNEVHPVDTWGKQFRKTIHYAYANAKFYKKHEDEFCNLTYSSYENLADLNMAFIEWGITTEKMEPKKEIILGSNLKVKSVKTQYYVDLCDKFDCNAILVGQPTVVSYLDLELLKKIEIEVRVQNWAPRSYKQYGVTQFEPNLSMLDAFFNVGNLMRAIKGTNRDYRIVK